MQLLTSIRSVRLAQWRLVAGCLYQTVWNVLTGRKRGTGIKDYDLIYFDDSDLSWAAEDRVIRVVAAATRGCVGPVEVRNQARVHLWFEARFGTAYPQLYSAEEAIRRYASIVHAIDGDSTTLRARKRRLAYAQSATSAGNLARDNRRTLEREGALRLMSQAMSRCLVIIDVQQGMFAFRRPLYQGEEVLERIAGLVEQARDARVPIFHVQHDGGSGHILVCRL
jgi:hypothetical protein